MTRVTGVPIFRSKVRIRVRVMGCTVAQYGEQDGRTICRHWDDVFWNLLFSFVWCVQNVRWGGLVGAYRLSRYQRAFFVCLRSASKAVVTMLHPLNPICRGSTRSSWRHCWRFREKASS